VQAAELGKRFVRSSMARKRQQPEAGFGAAVDAVMVGANPWLPGGLWLWLPLLTDVRCVVAVVRTDAVVIDEEAEDRRDDRGDSDGEEGESQAVDKLKWSIASNPVSSKTIVPVSGASSNPVKGPKSKLSLLLVGVFFGPSPTAESMLKTWS
jgi:hypothetical protein